MGYIFKVDHGYDEAVLRVIQQFPFDHAVVKTQKSKYSETKQSYNVLSGYEIAAEISTRYVFMIEEDILIATDFFEWHIAIQKKEPQIFCSLSTRNHNRRDIPEGYLDSYYLSTDDYCSLGVCFHRNVLKNYVLPHANHSYYTAPITYCKRNFPESKFGLGFSEQDGMIRRIQEVQGRKMPTAYPHFPRSYHCGFYGKNRKQKFFVKNLASRIEAIGNIIYDEKKMAEHALNEYFIFDSKPENLDIKPIAKFAKYEPAQQNA